MRPGTATAGRRLAIAAAVWLAPVLLGCQQPRPAAEGGVTIFRSTRQIVLPRVTRLGMNLGEQNYYDSGQMMKNLVFRNPGFEGSAFRSVLHCARVEGSDCLDTRGGFSWAQGFWDGGRVEVLDGAAAGRMGAIASSGPASGGYRIGLSGVQVQAGDWISVAKDFPGDPAVGWWTSTEGGAQLKAERADLAPGTAGKQALRIEAQAPGQAASVKSYFDSTEGRSFLRMRGRYRLSFRAKWLAGGRSIHLSVRRLAAGLGSYLDQELALKPAWEDYRLEFTANEQTAVAGTVELAFRAAGQSLLLDDVALERIDGEPGNRTAFRDEVVETLRELRPGVLRLMSGHSGLGSTVDNLLAPAGARVRPGYQLWQTTAEDIPVGIPEFLELCREVGAEPWITLPLGMSQAEARRLGEYLAGPASTEGGALRASEGQPEPWSHLVGTIHLELGNEVWNGIYAGETMEPAAYGRRANAIFRVLRQTAGGDAKKLDLVVGAQAVNAWPNGQILDGAREANSLAIAPYLMHSVTRWGSDDELYGPLLAEPEQMSRAGIVAQTEQSAGGRQLAVYEVNLHTTEGSAPQAVLDRLTPSAAAGVAVAEHMLRMMRDHAVRTQLLFCLPQFAFRRQDGASVRLWGSVVEMGPEGRKRPQFLAEELANRVVRGDLVRVETDGQEPMRDQPAGNDQVKLSGVHDLDAFGFSDGKWHGMAILNLGLHQARRVRVEGPGLEPETTLRAWRMVSSGPGANNEERVEVRLEELKVEGRELRLEPCSMVVVEWVEPGK